MPPLGHNLARELLNRERGRIGARGDGLKEEANFLSGLEFEACPTVIPLPPSNDTAGIPIVAKFNRDASFSNCQLLAIGGEEGVVTLAGTDSVDALRQGALDGSWHPRAHWHCHRNTIFDLAWAKSDSVLYTASGHQQVGVWDTDTARALAVAEGHEGSVKSISPLHLCEDVFATGARDGRMMLWDARCPGFTSQAPATGRRTHAGTDLDNAPVLSPIWVQETAQTRFAATSGRVSTKIAKKPVAVTVTSVAFLPYSYLLASAGAQDTVVKLWDMRMHGLPLCDLELPMPEAGRASMSKAKLAAAGCSGVPHEVLDITCSAHVSAIGVTHLAVSEAGDRLLVSCLDSQHHLFSLSHLTSGPLVTWRAPPPAFKGSFYMRSAFSPCGNYVLSGSRHCGAHIWRTAEPERPPLALPHEQEVTGVAWCGGDWSQVATCSDSGEVRLWTLSRRQARPAVRAEDAEITAMASHVAELDAAGVLGGVTQTGKALLRAQQGGIDATKAAGVSMPQVLQPVTSGHEIRAAVKPVVRRTIQLHLNLQRLLASTAPSATAPASATSRNSADEPPRIVPLLAVVEAPSAAADTNQAHAAALAKHPACLLPPLPDLHLLDCKVPPCAAVVRATALSSPMSSAPAQPAAPAGPSSVRRPGILPPVPIFSPAINCWQQQSLKAHPEEYGMQEVAAAAVRRADNDSISLGQSFSLEAALKDLAHVRTQSPARILQRHSGHGTDATGALIAGPDVADRRISGPGASEHHGHSSLFAQPHVPSAEPSVNMLLSSSFPSASGAAGPFPARSPNGPPRNTLSRSCPRVGLFSPSMSTPTSGGLGQYSASVLGTHRRSSGGACGTPTGSMHYSSGQRHQGPQGVVDQLLRNSPRHSSRTGHPCRSSKALLSARFSTRGAQEGSGDEADERVVKRRLFITDVEDDDQAGGLENVVQPDIEGAGVPRLSQADLRSGADIVTAVGCLLQHPDLRIPDGPESADLSDRHEPVPTSPTAYEFQDGHDVGPALRYRTAHPDELGPYVDLLEYPVDSLTTPNTERIHSSIRRGLHPTLADGGAAELRFTWDDLGPTRRAGAAPSTPPSNGDGEREAAGDDSARDLVLWESDGGLLVRRGSMTSGDSDWDSDWDLDPYGNKENTPPPEPLPAATPTSSASAGASGVPFMSPSSRGRPSVDQRLPLPLMQPSSPAPTRPAEDVPAATDVDGSSTPEHRTPPHPMTTPFADACPFNELPAPSRGEPLHRPDRTPSLHSEPTVSAGIAHSGGGAMVSAFRSVGEVVADTIALGPGCLLGAAPSADLVNALSGSLYDAATASAAGPSHPPPVESVGGGGEEHQDAARCPQVPQHHGDTLTPTKRPRCTFSFSDHFDMHKAFESPSSTRRVRSSSIMACPAPTPQGKQGCSRNASVMASPAVRGSRLGGASRVAPAPGAGYLATAAATPGAGIGSESPMPKVGTASRTGGRHSITSTEYLRSRAEEERNRGLMSPFGFGKFAAVPTPSGESQLLRTASRLANVESLDIGTAGAERHGPSTPDANGAQAIDVDPLGRALQFPNLEDDMGAMEQSVRSLSCVFETQQTRSTPGGSTIMAPCSHSDGDGAQEGRPSKHVGQLLRGRVLEFLEDSSTASPKVMGHAALQDGLGVGIHTGEDWGYFEPRESRGGCEERWRSFRFSSFVEQASQQHRQDRKESNFQQQLFAGSPATQLIVDESSRSFPLGAGDAQTVANNGGIGHSQVLLSALSVPLPCQKQGTPPVDSRPSFGLAGLHELSLRREEVGGPMGAGSSHGNQSQPCLPCALPRLGAEPSGVAVGSAVECRPGVDSHRSGHWKPMLQQFWDGASQRNLAPLAMRSPTPPRSLNPSRTLGPTGLTSPKYFR